MDVEYHIVMSSIKSIVRSIILFIHFIKAIHIINVQKIQSPRHVQLREQVPMLEMKMKSCN